ncbi:MAG: LysE family transporter [Desulfovibrionaceae bacterium]|nr:LysE family transporter [Desulfovibrionaceae bacterium]
MYPSYFFKGLAIGVSISAPVGPIGLLCIQRTLAGGRRSGLASGLGAAVADTFYGCVAGFGLSFVSLFVMGHLLWLKLVGGAFLCFMGRRMFLSRPVARPRPPRIRGLAGQFGSCLALTLTNPLTVFAFMAIFAGFGVARLKGDYAATAVLILGVFAGSCLWWIFLTLAAARLRSRIAMHLERMNRLAGLVIGGIGLLTLASIFFE